MSESALSRELAQCRFETEIASRLRNASRDQRKHLYSELYEAYARAFPESVPGCPDHPDPNVSYEVAFARRFVASHMVVAEIGPGRCEFAHALAPYCKWLYAFDVVDVSNTAAAPGNFTHTITDGIHIPLPDRHADLVISNQLMEHLHPDDALDQLLEVARVLRPGGKYICVTPNRLHGPHDCSARFDELPCPVADGSYVANGLHLKEYTNTELMRLFATAGFRSCAIFIGGRGHYRQLPAGLMRTLEGIVRWIPRDWRKQSRLFRVLLGVRVVATR